MPPQNVPLWQGDNFQERASRFSRLNKKLTAYKILDKRPDPEKEQ